MPTERDSPYIWVTWLTKLLVGENSCEWSSWFKAHYQAYEKVPSDFDLTAWQIRHTALLNRVRGTLEAQGNAVSVEQQNRFALQGSAATLGGCPDLIAVRGRAGTIYDIKTGNPRPSHHAQVMVYLYAVPKALRQFGGITFDGKVVYQNSEITIPTDAVNEAFVHNLAEPIRRLGASQPARKAPSLSECSFCEITLNDCPERVGSDKITGMTDDF